MRRVIAVVGLVIGAIGAAAAQPAAALKIVVLEGEGGVNIIQQKTAVRPLIEVRDRNNLPVAGASVTFSIGGGGQGAAFAGGAQTLTVTTNAAGQAAASGLNAVSSGAFQIQVQAAYQGQVATAAISQTNFATAAAASQAGAGAGSGSTATGATGGAAGGGGGLSATTIGIVGAAVGGGALAATKVAGKSDSDRAAGVDLYSGTLSGQIVFTGTSTNAQGQVSTCLRTRAVSGPITIELRSGSSTGTARLQVTQTEIAFSGGCGPAPGEQFQLENLPVSGGPSALAFSGSSQTSGGQTTRLVFTGSLSGNTISGTMSMDVQASANRPNEPTGAGATTLQVTLQKS